MEAISIRKKQRNFKIKIRSGLLTNLKKCSTMYYKGDDVMAFSIRLTEQEKKLAESYAKLHSLSLGEAFKQALFEKIEEEYDVTVAEEALREYEQDGEKSIPIDKLWEELGV